MGGDVHVHVHLVLFIFFVTEEYLVSCFVYRPHKRETGDGTDWVTWIYKLDQN